MGYERKRGKLEQFNALLRAEQSGDAAAAAFSDIVGDCAQLGAIKYVITLDTDTQLPRDAAQALVGNLAHPLNRPVIDPARGRVTEGYAILQPRASISLPSACRTRFTRLFAGEAGIDPYTREVSDVYQDLFGEGSFIGKGIYDVDAFRQAVDGRFPENRILSHDLLESGYASSGLVTDIDLVEEHPATYTAEASRRHRWIRGDWQIAGWLLPKVPGPAGRVRNPLTPLFLWKVFDNLRRSLVPPALLLLLIGGWLWTSVPAWWWTALVAAVLLLPAVLDALIELLRKPQERDWLAHFKLTGMAALRPLALAALFIRSPLHDWAGWAPLLLLWLAAPAIMWWISSPRRPPAQHLSGEQQLFLRALARRTWRYFADFVTAEEHWLPPDNFQNYPSPVIATRTSPTNIGMALLANQAAYDFGYLTAGELLTRTADSFATMERLERYRGHFYNWYDTRNLQALRPHYVSAVRV